MQMLRNRSYFLLCGLLLLLSLPARFAAIRQSLWMDEAWVANALLQPSLHELLFTKEWAQTTPPLFLLAQRVILPFAGHSEAAFRLIPVAAGLLGLGLVAVTYRKWLSSPAALLAFTLLCGNYWIIKYPQQAKQYGTDFLVSAALLFLLGRCLQQNAPSRSLSTLIAVAAVGLFLAYPAAFWSPSLLMCAVLFAWEKDRPQRLWWSALVLFTVVAIEYLVFIRPNRTSALVQSLSENYLDLAHPLTSGIKLIATLGTLSIGVPGTAALLAGFGIAILAVWGTIKAFAGWREENSRRGLMVVLGGTLPLLSVIGAGALHLYPVIGYPRMLIFALPSLALLLGFGLDQFLRMTSPAWERPLSFAVAGLCIAAVIGSVAIYRSKPRPAEENRPAMMFIQSHFRPDDELFIHPGMYEQYKYYRGLLGFYPAHPYIGNEQWPCCATGDRQDASDPSATDLRTDLHDAVRRMEDHRLWLLFPAAADGHWSAIYRKEFGAIPEILAANGCRRELNQNFGQTLVEAYICAGSH